MKNIIITFLGIFLLSATMNAAATEEVTEEVTEDATEEATEEVSPEEQAAAEAEAIDNSKTYCVKLPGHDVGNSGWTKRDNHIGAKWAFRTVKLERKFSEKLRFFTLRGNWAGQTVPDHYLYGIDYIWYSRGNRALCVNYERLIRDMDSDGKTVTQLWLDVKYGDDCARINLEKDGWYHARMKIVKKSGDLVNPWSCKRI